MTNGNSEAIEQKLDTIIDLLKHLLALELSREGVTQAEIGKHLRVAKAKVVDMLRGAQERRHMNDDVNDQISRKLNVLISLTIRQLVGDRNFEASGRGKRGVGAIARYLSDMGLDARDIAEILGAPLASVRTLLTPTRRR